MSIVGHYQNAYVTHDLDRAVELARKAFGIEHFATLDIEMVLNTPSGEQANRLRVGLGWAGNHQIELIQPVSGFIEPYTWPLPTDTNDVVPRLHHVAVMRDDLAAMTEEADSLGLPIVFRSDMPDLSCIYADARSQCGHFLEFVYATPTGLAMIGWPGGAAS